MDFLKIVETHKEAGTTFYRYESLRDGRWCKAGDVSGLICENSTLTEGCWVSYGSVITNSTLTDNSYVDGSDLCNSHIQKCFIQKSNLTHATCMNSGIKDSLISHSDLFNLLIDSAGIAYTEVDGKVKGETKEELYEQQFGVILSSNLKGTCCKPLFPVSRSDGFALYISNADLTNVILKYGSGYYQSEISHYGLSGPKKIVSDSRIIVANTILDHAETGRKSLKNECRFASSDSADERKGKFANAISGHMFNIYSMARNTPLSPMWMFERAELFAKDNPVLGKIKRTYYFNRLNDYLDDPVELSKRKAYSSHTVRKGKKVRLDCYDYYAIWNTEGLHSVAKLKEQMQF